MDYKDLLYEFSEGGLSREKEEILFDRLMTDSELRLEMKSLMMINSTLTNNRKFFTIPEQSRNIVMSVTGASANTANVHKFHLNPGKTLTKLFSNFGQLLAGGIISALLTSSIIILAVLPSFNNKNDITNKNLLKTPSDQLTINNILKPRTELKSNTIPQQVIKYRKVYSKTSSIIDPNRDNLTNIEINKNDNKISSLENALYSVNNIHLIKSVKENLSILKIKPFEQMLDQPGHKPVFSVEIRHTQNQFLSKPTISPAHYSGFNNIGCTLLYSLNNEIQLGADIRQETFFLEYIGTENDTLYRYEQQPNFTTSSLVTRYTPEFLELYNINPFIQLCVGANKGGFVGRTMAGLTYTPFTNMSFVLGFEYNIMLFSRQSQNFSSEKLSLNYGIAIRF